MISLADVTEGVEPSPLTALLYGAPGIGKTTLAAAAPGTVFLPFETGTKQLNVRRLPIPASFAETLHILREIATKPHAYQTLAIDTLTGLEALIFRYVCENPPDGKKRDSIEDFGYGKGHVYSLDQWARVLSVLETIRDRGMNVILIAHETTKRMPNPAGADYDQRVPDLYLKAGELVRRWVDNVFHATYKMGVVVAEKAQDKTRGKGVSTGARVIRTQWRPDAVAKNRYQLPYEMPLDFAALYAAIEASGAVPGAVEAFAKEARAEASSAGSPDDVARCLARIAACESEGDLAGLQRIVNYLRGKSNVDALTA